MSRSGPRLAAAALAGMLALSFWLPGVAQEATPLPEALGVPNHIHTGTCAELGDVVAPLNDLAVNQAAAGEESAMATPAAMAATPMAAMAAAGIPVTVNVTQIDMALADLLASPHAFNAHDPLDPSIYIACGDITGTPDDQGNLFVGVGEDSDSGLSGVVWLLDDGTGTSTTVTVFLVGEIEAAGE